MDGLNVGDKEEKKKGQASLQILWPGHRWSRVTSY